MAMLGSVYVHTDFIIDLLVIKTKPSPKASWKFDGIALIPQVIRG